MRNTMRRRELRERRPQRQQAEGSNACGSAFVADPLLLRCSRQGQEGPAAQRVDSCFRSCVTTTMILLMIGLAASECMNCTGESNSISQIVTDCHNFWGVSGRSHLKVYTSHNA